jgi:hypothetical protein
VAEYDIGYGKPPAHCKYKKGDRANPNGRRGKAGTTDFAAGDALARIRARKIKVDIGGGKIKPMWRDEYKINQLANLAMKGKLSAAKMLIDMHADSEAGGDFKCETKYISKSEAKIRRLSRLGKK